MRRQVFFLHAGGGDPEEVVLERRASRCRVIRRDGTQEVDVARLPDGRLSILFDDGRQVSVRSVARGGDGLDVVTAGSARQVPIGKRRQERDGALAAPTAAGGVEEILDREPDPVARPELGDEDAVHQPAVTALEARPS